MGAVRSEVTAPGRVAALWGESAPELLAGEPRPVYFKADDSLPYGFVIKVLAALDAVGVEQVGMVTQPEER